MVPTKKELRRLSKNQLIEIIFDLQRRVEKLEKHLLAYENPHTPPSLSKKRPPKNESSGKLGAPKGHPRYERKDPEPTGSVEYMEKTCPHCSSKLGQPHKTVRKIKEEIPEPQPIEVTEHLINHYICPKCNKRIVAQSQLSPGRFGKNVMAHVTLLKFDDRLPLRKVVASLERHYGLKLTDVAAMNITAHVASKLQIPYKQTVKRIRRSTVVYVDETKIKINGTTYWIWTFVTDKETVFVIRKSRYVDVIKEVLGNSFAGTICCDGWKAYSQYSNNLQRCWAHILREAEAIAKKHTEFEGFFEVFKGLFKRIKKVRSKPPPLVKRKRIKKAMLSELEGTIEQMNAYKEFRKFAGKVKNGIDYWFTCITNLLVEPTNNNAERALRELVVQRKIIGGLRRQKGATIMETVMTMIATWKMKGKPLFSTMKAFI